MNKRSKIKTVLSLAIAAVAIATLIAPPASAEIIVYEGFQYNAADEGLHGQPDDPGVTDTDATGLTGTWIDSATNASGMFLKAGSLAFGDLPTVGNHIGYLSNQSNDVFTRPLTDDAQTAIVGAGEIWFSILFEKLQNNSSAGEGGFALTNQVVEKPKIWTNDGTDGLAGFGFAPTTAGSDLKPYAWDGATQVAGDTAIPVPPANGSSNTDGSNFGDVRLIVGQISFDTGTDGKDQFTLYDYTLNAGSVGGGTLNQIGSTLEIDIDQSTLNTINLTRQVNLNYDELRIAPTLDEVLGAGQVQEFPPVVDAGKNILTWSELAITTDPNVTVVDAGAGTVSVEWSAPGASGVVIAEPTEEVTTVTVTKAPTGGVTEVTLQLKVTQGELAPVISVMKVMVYDDSCQAAKAAGVDVYDSTDFNQDCITNLADFAVIAKTWLNDYTLPAPTPR